MEKSMMNKILYANLNAGREMTISVTGTSMIPTLYEGNTVTIKRENNYSIGDILVFTYKGELLIHRLLKIENGRYFCKGDNSFRLEDLPIEDIAGKVVLLNGQPVPPISDSLIKLSYLVNRVFRQYRYNIQKTKESGIYRFYRQIITKVEDKTMKYKKNEEMDYIPSDGTSLAVFDPESGDTHFFDEVAIDILNCLDNPCDMDTLLDRLCDIYDASPEDIRTDVTEFLIECIAKKIILAI